MSYSANQAFDCASVPRGWAKSGHRAILSSVDFFRRYLPLSSMQSKKSPCFWGVLATDRSSTRVKAWNLLTTRPHTFRSIYRQMQFCTNFISSLKILFSFAGEAGFAVVAGGCWYHDELIASRGSFARVLFSVISQAICHSAQCHDLRDLIGIRICRRTHPVLISLWPKVPPTHRTDKVLDYVVDKYVIQPGRTDRDFWYYGRQIPPYAMCAE